MRRCLLALTSLLWPALALGQVTFTVSPAGNDAWSGRLADPRADGADGPFATLARARDAVRAMRRAGAVTGPVTVSIRAGLAPLAQTLLLTADDSGTAGSQTIWRAAAGERVVLSGARPVRGWQLWRDGIYVADLTAQGLTDARFRELFHRGRRQTLARFPNLDPAHPITGGLLYVADAAALDRSSFVCKPGTVPFAQWGTWPQAEVNIHPYHCWDHNIVKVAQVDPEAGLIRLRHSVAGSIFEGNRYFIQNVLGALDAPGEWYSDYATGRLYFKPPDGRTPADGDVTVPVLENLIELSGTPDKPITSVRVQGLWLTGARQDGLVLQGARQCEVVGCTVTQLGGVGLNAGYLRNALKGIGLPWRQGGLVRNRVHSGDRALVFGHPCQDCRLTGNDVYSVGGEGIALFGTGHRAENNHLYQTGLYDRVCAALTICGDRNTAAQNTIHDVPRDGIFINGAANVAEYNDIQRSMLYTADNAAIALRQHDVGQAVRNRGNILRFNRLLDTIGYGSYPHCTHPGDGYGSPFCSFGIYLDGSISGVTVYGNVIARVGGANLFIQFGGGNVVENNIFVEPDRHRLQYDAMVFFGTFMFADNAGRYRDQEPPNQLRHNIFAYLGPDTKLYQVGHWNNPAAWDQRQATFDDNLIWRGGRPVAVSMHRTLECSTFEQWQARGYDTRSLVGDPRFLDAAHDDYRLQPNSPAYRVGFKDINAELGRIGCQRGDERATWPLADLELRPEEPVVFALTKEPMVIADGFETTPVGYAPARAQVATSGTGSALVSDRAARDGRHCLRFIDAPNLKNVWQPHLYYRPSYQTGPVHLSIDLQNSADEPADFYVELRDWRGDLLVGPTFRVTHDGRLFVGGAMGAGGTELGRVPNGPWYTVTIDFALGDGAPKTYTLRATVPGQLELVSTQPFSSAGFREVTWFGISSTSDARASFCVDNLILGPSGADKVRDARTTPAFRGSAQPPVPPARVREDGLIGWWRMDEGGGHLPDSSGNALHGEPGGAEWVSGPFGKALYIGGGGAATVPDHPLLQFGTDDFTLECWLYPTSLAISGDNPRRRVIEKGGWPVSWWNIDLWHDGRVQMEMAVEGPHHGTTVSEGRLPERRWTHLVITVERQRRRTSYYFDGRLDSQRALPPDFTGGLNVSGKPLCTGTWQAFDGLLNQLRIYRRALPAAEVAAHHAAGRPAHGEGAYTLLPDD